MFDYLINRPRAMNTFALAWNGFFILYSLFFVCYNVVMDKPGNAVFQAVATVFFSAFFLYAFEDRKKYTKEI